MSESRTPTDELFEQQLRALERSQRTLTRSTMVPFQQAIEAQWNLGEMFLRGLELNESLQRMGADVTRSAFQSYLNSFENIATDMTRQMGQNVRGGSGSQWAPTTQRRRYGSQPPYGQRAAPPQQPPPQRAPPQQAPPQQAPPQQPPPQQGPPPQSPTEDEPPSEQQQPVNPPEPDDQPSP